MIDTTDGHRWVPAPYLTFPTQTGDILGVYLYSDEEVTWTYADNRIVGYTITKRPEFDKKDMPGGFSVLTYKP